MKKAQNIAYIDGQNLNLGTMEEGWKIDLKKFKVYLTDKYKIKHAYYYLGTINENNQDLYDNLQKFGFVVRFKDHTNNLVTKKKGNIDSDLIFEVMKNLLDQEKGLLKKDDNFEKIYIVSGDGDYHKLVSFLVKINKFGKILFPNKKFASSLYKGLGNEFADFLNKHDIRTKIEYISEKKEKGA